MKKNVEYIVKLILLSILIFCCGLSFLGCERKEEFFLYETENLIYIVSDKTSEIIIVGLTDEGKQQEYLIIPNTIDGKKVKRIGCSNRIIINKINNKYGFNNHTQIQSENLRKLFFVSDVAVIKNSWMVGDGIQYCPNLEGLFYISKKEYISANEYYELPFVENPANLSYFYNYDNAPNDNYYWIDNYAYGEKIEFIPPEPTREGYIFGGWHKESECINKWDYDVDTLPQAQYDKNEKMVYQETKLYAKWIEIGE